MRRPIRLPTVALCVLAFVAWGPRSVGRDHAVAAAAPHVAAVTTVGMTVADAARSTAFFCDLLGFTKVDEHEDGGPAFDRLWGVAGARARVVRLRLGSEELALTEFVAPKGRPYPAASRSEDLWFQHVAIVVSDMDAAYARVRPHVAAISTAPQTLPVSNRAAAGIAAFYFRDPDGHPLELIHFPAGKGDPRWQTSDGRLFLGIDHTAIAVRSTAASLAFYRDRLGLPVVGESRNVGVEQAQLTGVPGADVRITSLRAPSGAPGVELLEYLVPRDGRAVSRRARSNDVVHWHTTVAVDDVAGVAAALRTAGGDDGNGTAARAATGGSARSALVRDPDGHVLQLVGR